MLSRAHACPSQRHPAHRELGERSPETSEGGTGNELMYNGTLEMTGPHMGATTGFVTIMGRWEQPQYCTKSLFRGFARCHSEYPKGGRSSAGLSPGVCEGEGVNVSVLRVSSSTWGECTGISLNVLICFPSIIRVNEVCSVMEILCPLICGIFNIFLINFYEHCVDCGCFLGMFYLTLSSFIYLIIFNH